MEDERDYKRLYSKVVRDLVETREKQENLRRSMRNLSRRQVDMRQTMNEALEHLERGVPEEAERLLRQFKRRAS